MLYLRGLMARHVADHHHPLSGYRDIASNFQFSSTPSSFSFEARSAPALLALTLLSM